MHQTLSLPGDVYRKLADGAAQRGMTIESLLVAVSELVALPDQAGEQDRRRTARIEKLFDRFRSGQLSANDRAELDRLIDADYRAATERADRRISGKPRRPRHARPNGKQSRT
jgi:hypothetical protein